MLNAVRVSLINSLQGQTDTAFTLQRNPLELQLKFLIPRSKSPFAVLAMSLLISACANKAVTRQEDVDRYDALETQLIDETAADERRRKSEMRVAERLRQLDSERAQAETERNEARRLSQLENLESASLDDDKLLNLSDTTPVVTQVVVANSSDENKESLWALRNYPSPLNGSPICAVVSKPSKVINGSLDTNVTVIIGTDTVYLRTDATFDPAAPETGLRIDAGFPILFDSFLNELTGVIDTGYTRLRDRLESGSTLIVAFAYSPQLSTAETHVLELSLDSISEPLAQLASCDTSATGLVDQQSVDQSLPTESLDL